jgi:hypothetical protein
MTKYSKIPRGLYVDPNNLDNNNLTNVPVNPEDLSIYVELTTTSKSRSRIVNEKLYNSGNNIGKINFINGSQFGNSECDRSLTTSYTDISTTFDKPSGDESLEGFGISSIDITFDTAYTPLIKIQFIDTRGNMISRGNNSKYGIFFELPYPLFNLTVKGYYGKAVSYCLHLTRWNAKFNSQTGNFEIDAEFIGYTYAMLTDLLIGYLKAIPYTTIGGEEFKKVKEAYDGNIIDSDASKQVNTINDLLEKIAKLNAAIPDIKQESENFQKIASINKVNNILLQIKKLNRDFILSLGDDANRMNPSISGENFVYVKEKKDDVLNEYKSNINEKTSEINKYLQSTKFEPDNMLPIISGPLKYEDIKVGDSPTNIETSIDNFINASNNGYDKNIDDDKNRVTNLIKTNDRKLSNYTGDFYVYDLKKNTDEIDEIIKANEKYDKELREEFSREIRRYGKRNFNIDPTIGTIFRTLVAHCETFLRAVARVSDNAFKSDERKKELEKLINDLNIRQGSDIYPWPEYNVDGEETWIGSKVDKSNVDEVAFVEELLEALIKSKQDDINLSSFLENQNRSWFCLNPFDTPISIFGYSKNPYYRLGSAAKTDEYYRLLMYRMFMYLGLGNPGYSNTNVPNPNLLEFVAKFEAWNMFDGIGYDDSDFTKKSALVDFYKSADDVINSFTKGEFVIPGDLKHPNIAKYMDDIGSEYKYVYIQTEDTGRAYIPIDGDYDGSEFYNGVTLIKNPKTSSNVTSTYLGNYVNGTNLDEKIDDGATYLKIIDTSIYSKNDYKLPVDKAIKTYEEYKESDLYSKYPDENSLKELGGGAITTPNLIKNTNPIERNKFGVTDFSKVSANGDEAKSISNSEGYSLMSPLFFSNTDSRYGTRLAKNPTYSGLNTLNVVGGVPQNPILYEFESEGSNIQIVNNQITDTETENNVLTEVSFGFAKTGSGSGHLRNVSLFGSPLYYAQEISEEPDLAKAFMFLNSLPLKGLLNGTENDFNENTLFNNFSIGDYRSVMAMFTSSSAFINSPALWVYWVGSILWRYEYHKQNDIDPIITKTNNVNINLVPGITVYPKPNELFFNLSDDEIDADDKPAMFFSPSGVYRKVDKTLLNLPKQIKDEFIQTFISWSNNNNSIDSGFKYLRSILEVFPDGYISNDNGLADLTTWQGIITVNYSAMTANVNIDNPWYQNNPINYENYKYIFPNKAVIGGESRYYSLTFNFNTQFNNTMMKLFGKQLTILNASPLPFYQGQRDDSKLTGTYKPITVAKTTFKKFLEVFVEEFKRLYDDYRKNKIDEDTIKNNIFQSKSNDLIKLQIYRHLSAINNKWLGSENIDGKMFYPCSDNGVSGAYNNLFDSFSFLDKGFIDISDDFIINPTVVSDLIIKNYNQSFFDLISNILANNNFNFIPLPTFINFKTEKGLKDIFRPISYIDMVSNDGNTTYGPSFVCVYAGQTSTSLDLGNNSDFVDDGVDFSPCGKPIKSKILNSSPDSEKFQRAIPIFEVNYAQQNQNYFKDLNLDQREFIETEESLVIIDKISKSGDKNDPAFKGQNLFNVYQTRSYSAKVDAMGMPMIQPMMYFQLNNIPMFRGGYMIINTSHNIKPNHMTTQFTGVRIKDVDTPLNQDIYEIKDLILGSEELASIKYNLPDPVVNTDNTTGYDPVPVKDANEDTATGSGNLSIYEYNFRNSNTEYGFNNSLFDRESNTVKNGTRLTYNEIFDIASKLTKVDIKVLKTLSVLESVVGTNKGGIGDGMNPLGYVGLMQFGDLAAKQVAKSTADLLFNKLEDLNQYTFFSTVDYNKKSLVIPNDYTSNTKNNNRRTNSFFDDLISIIAAAQLALFNLNTNPTSLQNTRDAYLSHQQGKTGYNNIITNDLTELNDGSALSGRMLGNKPLYNDIKYLRIYRDWVNGWCGRIDAAYYAITDDYKPSINVSKTPNADKLRATLKSLGYREKNREITSAGKDINSEIEKYASAIFKKIKQLYPTYTIEVTAGNDTSHKDSAKSRHKTGDAIDFVIYVNGQKIPTPSDYITIRKQNNPNRKPKPLAQQKAVTYSPQNEIAIDNVKKIIQGFVVGKNPQFKFLDEYRYPSAFATGSHFHISYREDGGTEGSAFTAQAIAALDAGQITEYTV